jgi:peptidase C39-like protein
MLTSLVAALSLTSLTVPYLPQTDALCGGAAAAMVFRYWGDAHADIEQFAPLVDKRAGGIADDVLVRAIEERGWLADIVPGSIDQLSEQVQSGYPVVILVAVGGPVYHYVVVTGIEPDAVIVHDPTWGPSRRMRFEDLIRAWQPTNFWSLVIKPSATRTASDRAAPETLEVSGPVSELAGVRFAEQRWREAAALAERAVRLDPADRYAWEILAASRFIQDDTGGALRAWNRVGKPRINLVVIDGLVHARFQTIAAAMGLQPNMLLTESAFRLAERRLQDLPDRVTTRLTLRPEPDGFATVKAVVVEHAGPPQNAVAWTIAGVEAAVDREARVAIPGSTGQGEVWSASWRWWNGRPRLALGFSAPHVGRFSGVWRVDASWESQTYRSDTATALGVPLDESRTHGALTLGGWLAPNVRYSASAGIDSWSGVTRIGRTAFAGGSLERRWLADRWSLAAGATSWTAAPGRPAFHEAAARTTFRSSRLSEGWVYLADAGVQRVTDSAPLGLWPGAGEGRARDALLRAHPLLNGGTINLTTRAVFGKTLVDTHAEAQRWLASASPIRIGIAAFGDLARASRRREPADGSMTQIDMGTGVRVRLPGATGTLRVDIAHGMRDGADALTLGWQY